MRCTGGSPTAIGSGVVAGLPRPLIWAALLSYGVALASCGAASRDEAERTRSTAPIESAIVIHRPTDGSRMPARETDAGQLQVHARVRGSARPGSVLVLHASCRPLRCSARVTAGADGRWTAAMALTTTRADRFVTIDAMGSEPRAVPAAVTTLEFVDRSPRGARGEPTARPARRAGSMAEARREAPSASTQSSPTRSRSLPRDVLVIGDSLAVGMADSLRAALPGWRIHIDARINRRLAEGMKILAERRDAPAIVAFSLFTNDAPTATAQLAQAVLTSSARPGSCAVWATIVRPPLEGVSYARANQVLEQLASDHEHGQRLMLVDWKSLVTRVPSFLAGGGVHATPEGYRARGQRYADAIRACAGET